MDKDGKRPSIRDFRPGALFTAYIMGSTEERDSQGCAAEISFKECQAVFSLSFRKKADFWERGSSLLTSKGDHIPVTWTLLCMSKVSVLRGLFVPIFHLTFEDPVCKCLSHPPTLMGMDFFKKTFRVIKAEDLPLYLDGTVFPAFERELGGV